VYNKDINNFNGKCLNGEGRQGAYK
jgi:hypothetical protein